MKFRPPGTENAGNLVSYFLTQPGKSFAVIGGSLYDFKMEAITGRSMKICE